MTPIEQINYAHSRRVTDLINANTKEVERRRKLRSAMRGIKYKAQEPGASMATILTMIEGAMNRDDKAAKS